MFWIEGNIRHNCWKLALIFLPMGAEILLTLSRVTTGHHESCGFDGLANKRWRESIRWLETKWKWACCHISVSATPSLHLPLLLCYAFHSLLAFLHPPDGPLLQLWPSADVVKIQRPTIMGTTRPLTRSGRICKMFQPDWHTVALQLQTQTVAFPSMHAIWQAWHVDEYVEGNCTYLLV